MSTIIEGFREALRLLFSFDSELIDVVSLSVWVSVLAVLLAILIGMPLGILVGLARFRGRRVVITLLNTTMAIPTVAIGLILYALLSRHGPLGGVGVLFTPWAMVIGQCLLALPIVTCLSVAAVGNLNRTVVPTVLTLGASRSRAFLTLVVEVRFAMAAALAAAFARVFSEVGISMMVGGNIRGYTRNVTTGIAFETGRGEFALGIALGVVLVLVALLINVVIQLLQSQGSDR